MDPAKGLSHNPGLDNTMNQVAVQATQIYILYYQQGPRILTWPQVVSQTVVVFMFLGGSIHQRYQHRCSVWLDYGPKGGPCQHPGPGCHYGSGQQHRPLRYKYGSSSCMALKHQNNLRRRPRSWVSALPSIATGALDIACPGGEGTGEQVLNA